MGSHDQRILAELRNIAAEQRRQADAITRLESMIANIAGPMRVPMQGNGNGMMKIAQPPPAVAMNAKRPRISEASSAVDTVAILGAVEAGFDVASLQDFFSQQPGFIQFKENAKMGGGFSKFESPELALQACNIAQESGIPAQMAKSSMGGPPQAGSAPMAMSRSHAVQNPGQVDTVACIGAADAGFDEMSLRTFFSMQPGFLIFKENPKMGGGFSKFETPDLAAQACAAAMDSGIPAQMAKSSMGGPSTVGAGQSPMVHAFNQQMMQKPPMKRPRMPENPANIDTVASLGAADAGYDDVSLQDFFASQPGFIAFKANARMKGGFSKFESAMAASEAIAAAQDAGIPAELAKSSMSTIS